MKNTVRAGLAATAAAALVAGLATATNAYGDYAPIPQDVVGVGGDTPQFDLQFLADGSSLAHTVGYNSTGNRYKLVTFNATPDGNARAAYANGSTQTAPLPLNATDVLREGTAPVQRVQSSGAAINALLADTGKPETINFVFSASLPTAAQQSQANDGTHNWGYLHVVELGKDAVQIAAGSTTNAPAGLSAAQLLAIYTGSATKWNQVGGSSNATIVPLLPPSSSSITKTFLADLKTANGNNPVTLSPNVKTVEQNDPTAITGASSPADAIVPFSSARLKLYRSGYFHDPSVVYPGGGAITPGVAALTGAPSSGSVYSSQVNHYVIFRQTDLADAPWQPGSGKNWAQALFSGSTAWVKTTSGLADIAAAGTTPDYHDLGNVSSG